MDGFSDLDSYGYVGTVHEFNSVNILFTPTPYFLDA